MYRKGVTFPTISKLEKESQSQRGEILISEDPLGKIFCVYPAQVGGKAC